MYKVHFVLKTHTILKEWNRLNGEIRNNPSLPGIESRQYLKNFSSIYENSNFYCHIWIQHEHHI